MGYLDLADRSWPLLHRVMGLHTMAYQRRTDREIPVVVLEPRRP